MSTYQVPSTDPDTQMWFTNEYSIPPRRSLTYQVRQRDLHIMSSQYDETCEQDVGRVPRRNTISWLGAQGSLLRGDTIWIGCLRVTGSKGKLQRTSVYRNITSTSSSGRVLSSVYIYNKVWVTGVLRERVMASTSLITWGCFILDILQSKYLLDIDLGVPTCRWKYFDYTQVWDQSQRW